MGGGRKKFSKRLKKDLLFAPPVETVTEAELSKFNYGTESVDADGNAIQPDLDESEEEDTSMYDEPDSEDSDEDQEEGGEGSEEEEDDGKVIDLKVGGFKMPDLPDGMGLPASYGQPDDAGEDDEDEEVVGEEDDFDGGEAVDSEEERQAKAAKKRAPIELPSQSKKRKAEETEEEEAPRKRVVFSYKTGALVKYEGDDKTIVNKPAEDAETPIPFLHYATEEQKLELDREQRQGRCLVVFHKPEYSWTQMQQSFRKMGIKVKLAYRLRSEPYEESGNVDSFVVCNSSEHATKATKTSIKDYSGGFMSDCRLWLQREHVGYVRGVPLTVTDEEIRAFFGKKCGKISWIHRLTDTGQIGLHFENRKSLNKAMHINNQDIDYNGKKVTVSLKITKSAKKGDQVYNKFPNFTPEHWAQLRDIGKILYHKGDHEVQKKRFKTAK